MKRKELFHIGDFNDEQWAEGYFERNSKWEFQKNIPYWLDYSCGI